MSDIDTFICPLCKTRVPYGAFICTGCGGDVLYGAADSELGSACKVGGEIAVVLGVSILLFFPALTSRLLGWNIALGLGMGPWSLLPIAVLALFGCSYARAQAEKLHKGQIRVSRQY